jgi:hypothetical protein
MLRPEIGVALISPEPRRDRKHEDPFECDFAGRERNQTLRISTEGFGGSGGGCFKCSGKRNNGVGTSRESPDGNAATVEENAGVMKCDGSSKLAIS